MEMLRCFSPALREELACLDPDRICDIRLFAGGPCMVRLLEGEYATAWRTDEAEVLDTAQALCGRMLRLSPFATGEGYITLRGGHRMGLCGRVTVEREGLLLHELGSVCIRVAHQVPGCGRALAQILLRGDSALVVGPPASGKTTLLRDAVRLVSDGGIPVGLADERGEVAGCLLGVPQLDVGRRTHVVEGCRKADALRWLLRSMSPGLLATDELYGEAECQAVREAAACGVPVVCTVHAAGAAQLCARQGLRRLLREGIFGRVLFLHRRQTVLEASAEEVLRASCLSRR